jgi:ABC-type bacteriocin/lantibiotic exporter with double-glycine peptidase domain
MEAFFAQKSVKILLLDGIAVSFQTIIGVILLAFYHPFFLIFSLVIFVVVILLITILWRPGVRTSYLESDAKYEVYEWLQDLAAYPLLFKSERGETLAVRKADNLTTGYIAARRNHFRIILTHYSAAVLLQTLGSAALLGLGGYLVAKQQLTLGQLVAAELILTVVLESVNKFGKQLEVCFDLAASIAKLDSLMNIPHEELSGTRFGFSQQPASLKLDRVAVRNWDGPLIIKNITCSLAPGEKIAIWGENGSGKSLLADCIFRLNTPHAGRIEIDNHPISDIHPLELRSEVVLVRGVEIFHGTVNENLTLGHESVSADEVRRSLLLVDLLDDILELPQGLNTYIKGHSILSSGQSNRLMIARALLERPRLFLIDGTLDQVDDQSRIKVLKSLLGEENPATLLVFTHDKEILCHFDRSYILQDGELVHG